MNPQQDHRFPFFHRSMLFCELVVLVLLFIVLIAMAWNIPMNTCPDEAMRNQLVCWICEHHALPSGYETELITNEWGFSYSSEPLLPCVLSACLMYLCRIVGGNSQAIFFSCRLTSVLSLLGCYLICLRIGRRIFQKKRSPLLFAVFICFNPQVLFCGSYFNNDIPALFGCLLTLDALLQIRASHWQIKPCILLAFSLSIIILSYYNAYGWIMFSLIWCCIFCTREKKARGVSSLVWKRFILIAGTVLLLTGWFFIRNMILYDGDITGLSYRKSAALSLESKGSVLTGMTPFASSGNSVFQMLTGGWMHLTFDSFFGLLGYMDIYISKWELILFQILFTAGVLTGNVYFIKGIIHKKRYLTDFLCLTGSILVPFVLSILYSYYGDYQPQGRYLFSALPTLALFSAMGYESINISASHVLHPLIQKMTNEHKGFSWVNSRLICCVITIWILLSGFAFCSTIHPKLISAPRLKIRYVQSKEDRNKLKLTYTTFPHISNIRFAVWSKSDQEDLQWISAELSPTDHCQWIGFAAIDESASDTLYIVHVYGADHHGKDQLLEGWKAENQFVLFP